MSAFLDANILFSASNTNSSMHRLLLWLSDKEKLITSNYALAEAQRNIITKRPQWKAGLEVIIDIVRIVPESALKVETSLPEKDKPILGAAIAAKSTYLVTGYKRDFGHLYNQTVSGVTIISVLEFTKAMLKVYQIRHCQSTS